MINRYSKLNNKGFAPLLIAVVVIIVLSLVTVGFVLLMNNNQNNALKLQLNNDAYYAAESGVNDAVQAINHGYNQTKNTCAPIPSNQYLKNNQIDGPNDTYSCLLINPLPTNLVYSEVRNSEPTVVILSAVNANSTSQPVTLNSINISWQPSSSVSTSPYAFAPNGWFPQCNGASEPCFPPKVDWVNNQKPITSVLKVALTPLYNGAIPTNTSTTLTAFLYPASAQGQQPSTLSYSPSTIGANAGEIVSGDCSNSLTPDACSVTINLTSANATNFLLEINSIYNSSQVTITGYNNSKQVIFRNAQAVIDSTGDYRGVLKRIQVRTSSFNDTGFPSYDIASGNTLCKEIVSWPGNKATGNPGGVSNGSCGL